MTGDCVGITIEDLEQRIRDMNLELKALKEQRDAAVKALMATRNAILGVYKPLDDCFSTLADLLKMIAEAGREENLSQKMKKLHFSELSEIQRRMDHVRAILLLVLIAQDRGDLRQAQELAARLEKDDD